MPIIFKSSKKTPAKKEPEKVLCDHGTQTKLCLTKTEMPQHQDYPVILYPRFWDVLNIVTQFSTHGRIGFSCSNVKETDDHDYVVANSLLKYVFGFKEIIGYTVPMTAVGMSIASENFTVGKSAFEFPPENLKFLEADSDGQVPFFTYQLITDRIQATYFNYKGMAYLAGITFIMRLASETKEIDQTDNEDISSSQKAFEHTWLSRRHFPDENVTHHRRFYGRDCQRLRRRVLVSFNKHHNKVVHMMFNNASKEFWMDFCSKCDGMEMTPSTYFARKLNIPTYYPTSPHDPDQAGIVHSAVMRLARNSKKDTSFHISLTRHSANYQLHLGAQLPFGESPRFPNVKFCERSGLSETSSTSSSSSSSMEEDIGQERFWAQFLEPGHSGEPLYTWKEVIDLVDQEDKEKEVLEIVNALNAQEDQPRVESLSDEDYLKFIQMASKVVVRDAKTMEVLIDVPRQAYNQLYGSLATTSASFCSDSTLHRSIAINTEVSVNDSNASHLDELGRATHSPSFSMYGAIPSDGATTRAMSMEQLSEYEVVSDTGAEHGSDVEEELPIDGDSENAAVEEDLGAADETPEVTVEELEPLLN